MGFPRKIPGDLDPPPNDGARSLGHRACLEFFVGSRDRGECGMYVCTWNPNDPCFDVKRPCFGGVDLQK